MGKKQIRVYVRTRPTATFSQDQIFIDGETNSIRIVQTQHEDEHGQTDGGRARSDGHNKPMDNKRDSWTFQFHRVLHNTGQDTTYDVVADDLVRGCIEGVNGTIMAYGQTGAGKTFTMIGDTSQYKHRGIIPRAIAQLFGDIADRPEQEFKLTCSYMELYNERILDLLEEDLTEAGSKDYAIAEDPETHTIHVRGLRYEPIGSEEDALNLLFRGEKNRVTAEHQLNQNSNRSHSIFTIHIQRQSRVRSEEVIHSKLNLVDLAGSERLKKALEAGGRQVDDKLRKESMYINKSLTYLEQVVVALTGKKRTHVPYRQSKLTNVLKDSLGGNCNTALVACMWGEAKHLEETISTLKLAQRMMRVENQTTVNVHTDPIQLIKRYERQIRELKQELMMHDALVNRSGITYDEYTPEESMGIAQRVRAYVNAKPSEEEANEIAIESVQQIRECFRQFKILVLNAESHVEERLRAQFSFDPRADLSNGDETTPESNQHGDSPLTSQDNSEFVGEEEEGSGYGLGHAPPHAKPDLIEGKQVTPERGDSDEFLEDEEKRESKFTTNGEDAAMRNIAHTNSRTDPIPIDREEAFRLFINVAGFDLHSMSTRLAEEIRASSQAISSARSGLKEIQSDLKCKQQALETMRSEQKHVETKGGEQVIDEEEFILMKEVKRLKKEFRALQDKYNAAKQSRQQAQAKRDVAQAKLLQQFEDWHANNTSDKNKNKNNDVDVDEDVLDDGEQFEKLELERVLAEDPESVAFFKASKANNAKGKRPRHRRGLG